jgi:nicotinamide-nucleotide amidase
MALSMELLALGEQVGERLQARQETVAVAESAAGGLIAAALLAVAGASAYFTGGAVVYTRDAKTGLLGLDAAAVTEPRPSTEAHALVLARGARDALHTTWGIGETGAAGPTGNRYGDAAGHDCYAVAGPIEEAATLETGIADRRANMEAFASAALRLLLNALGRAG